MNQKRSALYIPNIYVASEVQTHTRPTGTHNNKNAVMIRFWSASQMVSDAPVRLCRCPIGGSGNFTFGADFDAFSSATRFSRSTYHDKSSEGKGTVRQTGRGSFQRWVFGTLLLLEQTWLMMRREDSAPENHGKCQDPVT